jgi:hypothetical protein
LFIFGVIGTANLTPVNELFPSLKKTIKDNPPESSFAIKCRIILGDLYSQINAEEHIISLYKEAEQALCDGKYKAIPHGWHLYETLKQK